MFFPSESRLVCLSIQRHIHYPESGEGVGIPRLEVISREECLDLARDSNQVMSREILCFFLWEMKIEI